MIVGRVKERDKWNIIDFPFLGISEMEEIVLFLDKDGNGLRLSGEEHWANKSILMWDMKKFKPFNGKIEIENKER